MPSASKIPAAKRRQAYDDYCHRPSITVEAIATFLSVTPSAFRRLRKTWGWPPRPEALRQAREAQGSVAPSEASPASSLREAALSLAQVTRSHINALVKEQRRGEPLDHDRTARTLASYAKTLTTAQALLDQGNTTPSDDTEPHDTPPRSLNALRDELAHHLERVVAEEEARGGDGLLV